MATILKVLGWKARGFRCPDHEISLEKQHSDVFSVSLIQMPNGTGKTTTLSLLRAALSGSAVKLTKDEVLAFRKIGSDTPVGFFQLSLLHDSRRLTIEITFDFVDGTVKYATISNSGKDSGFNPPHDLRKFFRPDFVRFFAFDGELAAHILDNKRTDAQIAIMDLFQLTIFKDLMGAVEDYWDKETQNSGATELRGFQRRKNRVINLKDRIAKCTKDREDLTNMLNAINQTLEEKQEKFSAAISQMIEYREKLAKAENILEKSKQCVSELKNELIVLFRDPHALSEKFARELIILKDSLDKVKLPESVAREFFHELSCESICVCGRALDDDSRESIYSRANLYLGSENISLLNAIKKDISDFVDKEPQIHERQLQEKLTALLDQIRNTEIYRSERDRIRIEATQEDPELEKVRNEISDLKDKKSKFEIELFKYEDTSDSANDDDTFGISVLKARLTKAENDLSEITQTIALKEKRDTLLSLLERALLSAQNNICLELCRESNEKIMTLMPYNSIRVKSIDRSLNLAGQESGSVGENLSIAYAFLSTLFNRSEHQLPFIVDSPAGPIDLDVRPQIGKLAPKLTGQFIAFVISSERQNFLNSLENASGGDLQYITLFRKGPVDYEKRAFLEQDCKETEDGFCVGGREFFMNFHRDEEKNNAIPT